MIHQPKLAPIIFALITFIFSLQLFGQTTVVNDPLNGSTVGEKVGGSFSSEGYKPGKGENHILYKLPQITNGYIEFEVKGFHPSNMPSDEDHAFAILYDGRGISEPVKYYNDFKYNYFRWNFHWRGNRSAFKAVITCANPTTARINSTYAVFPGGGDLRDWFSEPTGKGWSWNASTWYKMKIEWKDKKFSASVNGTVVWSTSGPNDYAPKDLRIWLGSGPDKYNSDVSDQVFRNFKVVSYGGTVTPTNSLSLSPSSQNVGSTAGSTNLTVSSNVSWSASSNASWLSVTPTSGSNNNTLTANFGVNSSSSSRTATVTVTGGGITRTATITQAGTSSTTNTLAVTPASQSVGSSSGTTNFSIASNVSWAVSDNASWLNVSPTSGSNNSSLNVTFDQNTSTSSRTATITTVGGGITRTVSVTQAGTSTNGGGNFITVPEILNLPNSYGKITV
ncbi:MAG: BACON domain-containing protein, partial [Ignavibacteriales bacterium]|nr:BACON domain-containing protein [Ignavibacteriales bacterium]